MNFEHMWNLYFKNWAKPPDVSKREPGKIYHFGKGEILVPRYR